MESLEARALVHRYGDRVAVDGLSFRVGRGEILGFLGPNGAGKTTTFKILSGLLPASGGELFLDGTKIERDGRALRSRMGVVFQHASLDAKLTGRENLSLGAGLYGLTGDRAKEKIAEALARVQLGDRADDFVESYSGGMRRRLELARVLLHDPEIVLMDEPTQGLDVAATRRIWKQLLDLRKERGLTILLTTHSAEEAEHCDRIVVLDRGHAIAEGTPAELRAKVGGDVLTIACDDPEELAGGVREKLGGEAVVADGNVVLERPDAHALIPRLIEAFPKGRIKSIGMRQASIGDVFLKLTGQTIEGADVADASEQAKKQKRKGKGAGASKE